MILPLSTVRLRIFSQTYNPHKLLPWPCCGHFTRIESIQNLHQTRINQMRGPRYSTSYIKLSKYQLLFPITQNNLGELFPYPAHQRKWIKELLITWYQEINESCRYSAIIFGITSGALLACPPTHEVVNFSSRRLLLYHGRHQCLAEYGGTCARITHQLHLTLNKRNRKYTRQ